jgi:hypothetical protein
VGGFRYWGRVLEGDCGPLVSSSLLLPECHVMDGPVMYSCHDILPHHRPKQGPTNHGLETLNCEPKLIIPDILLH